MWTPALLKHNAKISLQGHWLYSILSIVIRIACTVFFWQQLVLSNLFPILFVQTDIHKNLSYYLILGISALLLLLARFLVLNPITVGLLRFFMEQRQGTPPFSTLFSIFTAPSYWNVVRQLFLRDVQVFILSFLLVVPGIYRGYQLRFVPWFLAENPELLASQTFSLSISLTKDEVLSLFMLDLSFFGWLLLSCISLGIGFFFLLPFYYATVAESYAAFRVKAFSLSPFSQDWLPGFLQY